MNYPSDLINFIEKNLLDPKQRVNCKRGNFRWFEITNNIDFYNQINRLTNHFHNDTPLNVRIQIIYQGILEAFKCIVCGKLFSKKRLADPKVTCCKKCKIIHNTNMLIISNLKHYNSRGSQTPLVAEKRKQTNLARYGTENVRSSDIIKKRIKNKIEEKYGTYNVMHNSNIAEKAFLASRKWKEYILPSGKIIKVQGYENKCLDEILKFYNETDILHSRTEMPYIAYIFNGSIHRYYPDFYIPKDNLIIEVKSEYTLMNDKKKNRAKFEATISQGYKFKLMIYK